MNLRATALFLALPTLASIVAAQSRYRVTELVPPTGYDSTVAYAINDLGVAVGACSPVNPDFNSQAAKWVGGQPVLLGLVQGGNYSVAEGINASGRITGEADNGNIRPQTTVFENGVAFFIDSGANNSRGTFVAEDGTIVGNYDKGFGGNGWFPTIWTEDLNKPGDYRHLFLPRWVDPNGGSATSYANGANNLGQVVGQLSSSTLWSARGGLWNNDAGHSLTVLDPVVGTTDCYALGINDSGWGCGTSYFGIFWSVPVLWSPDAAHTPTPLPLFPGETSGTASAINKSGLVIGTHGVDNRPALWFNGRIYNLQSLLDQSGAGWTLQSLSGINSKGQIVGNGLRNGQSRGFVLTPTKVPVPLGR